MRATSRITMAAVLTSIALPLLGHGGGLDKNGCHTNRKTGDYHCHGSARQAPEPPSATARQTPAVTYLASPLPAIAPEERTLVRTAQVLLNALGYRPSLLGNLDARTRTAIEAFQSSRNEQPDGKVTAELLLQLAEAASLKCR